MRNLFKGMKCDFCSVENKTVEHGVIWIDFLDVDLSCKICKICHSEWVVKEEFKVRTYREWKKEMEE